MQKKDYQPLIIIGAARSGTKILRDVIASHPDVDKVPFDINYIWRLGNERLPHDELHTDQLTPAIKKRIIKNIQHFHKGAPILIEKTVSNCLRVPFVSAVYPHAKFIHLIRHGEDVVESVYRQWNVSPDLRYILKKARTYPLLETPGYALRYVLNTLRRSTGINKQAAIWGPAYHGIQDDVNNLDLWQVCAIQWCRSVQKAYQGLSMVESDRIIIIHYEEFVQSPAIWLEKIADFLAIDSAVYQNHVILNRITVQNVGKAQKSLTAQQKAIIKEYLQPGMELGGYDFYS